MHHQKMRLQVFILLSVIMSAAADWPQFLGMDRTGKSGEQDLVKDLSRAKIVWTHLRGESYSAPSVSGDFLIHHTRFQSLEKVQCLNRTSGMLLWEDAYPTTYTDRFNYLSGPRSTPSIDDGRVYVLGVQGVFSCYDLVNGTLFWRRDLAKEFELETEFFGFTPSPLVEGNSVILNLGMKKCVASFDKLTGKTNWIAGNEWGRSYASPVAAAIHGKRVLLVFAGGESSPPVGGLLCIDPESGKIHDRFPWRSHRNASVNASTPVVHGNRVFISSSYDVGGVMLELTPEMKFREVYRTKAYASHWATPILVDGHLYGFANNKLVCMNWDTGERMWRIVPKVGSQTFQSLEHSGRGGDRYRPPPGKDGFGIGSMIYVDGRFLVLGENGLLAWMKLSSEGCEILSSRRLFSAEQTWVAPVLSDKLLYICKNKTDRYALRNNGNQGEQELEPPKLICLDLHQHDR